MIQEKRRRCGRVSGYRVTHPFIYRMWNLILLIPIFIAAFPVIFLLYVLLFFTQGTPVFYRGVRLGKDMKPFYMYKFRTLVLGAEVYTQNQVLPAQSGLETRLGKFLRESRLDELPQLFNILKGEMNFIGPRPVRPEIAREGGGTIKNYNIRFSVKPGLVGYTQLFMTHRTPKKIRARFNSYFCRRKVIFWKEPGILLMTVTGMMRKMGGFIKARLLDSRKIGDRALLTYHEPQKPLSLPNRKMMLVSVTDHHPIFTCLLLDIDHETFSFFSAAPISKEENMFLLQRNLSSSQRRINACCFGRVVRKNIKTEGSGDGETETESQHFYMVYYTPASEFDFYKIDKYFLNNSILN
jgi:lipopolysaccharide/colanic/teichoic acid biosynthesis glycosyltransferase